MARKPVIHGRDHAPGGADPIPAVAGGGIQFEVENEGAWLAVYTDGEEDGDGIRLDASNGGNITISSQDDQLELKSGTDMNLQHGGDFYVFGAGGQGFAPDGYFTVTGGANINLNAANNLATSANGTTTFTIGSGSVLRVRDSSGNPVFEVRDDGTVHILTGGTVVADL